MINPMCSWGLGKGQSVCQTSTKAQRDPQQNLSRTSAEPQQNLSKTSAEPQQNLSRISTESQQKVNRIFPQLLQTFRAQVRPHCRCLVYLSPEMLILKPRNHHHEIFQPPEFSPQLPARINLSECPGKTSRLLRRVHKLAVEHREDVLRWTSVRIISRRPIRTMNSLSQGVCHPSGSYSVVVTL